MFVFLAYENQSVIILRINVRYAYAASKAFLNNIDECQFNKIHYYIFQNI